MKSKDTIKFVNPFKAPLKSRIFWLAYPIISLQLTSLIGSILLGDIGLAYILLYGTFLGAFSLPNILYMIFIVISILTGIGYIITLIRLEKVPLAIRWILLILIISLFFIAQFTFWNLFSDL